MVTIKMDGLSEELEKKFDKAMKKHGFEPRTHSEAIGCRMYCIRNDKGEYWSNDWGWLTVVDDEESTFDVFTENEKEIYNLPIGGHWEVL